MRLTCLELTNLIRSLEEARRAASGPGCGHYCTAPREGPDGQLTRFVPKPRARMPVGHVYPGGETLVEEQGVKGVRISNGVHGRAFLAIHVATGEICCAACGKKGGA
jgi:hypothetical protein